MSVRTASLHRLSILSILSPVFSLTALGGLAACGRDDKLAVYNAEPKAEITSPVDGAAALSGTALTLRGAASDDNDAAAELSARWFVNDAEACPAATPAADGTTTCDVIVPEGDTVSIRLEVIDPQGEAGTDTVTLSVTPNAAPTAIIDSPLAAGVYYSDQLITFRGTVADAEDDAASLTAWWEDGATRLEAVDSAVTSSGEVLGYTTLSEGAHALELHVLDLAGGEGIATVLIDVGPPNSSPDCAITAPADGTADSEGATVIFRGTAADADIPADQLAVTWVSDKDGVIGTSLPTSGGSITFPYAGLSVNTHVVTMQVEDEVGAMCTAELLYTVGSPPTIDLEAPAFDQVVNEGENAGFIALVADNEDSAADLWVTWETDVDGVFYEGPPDSAGVAQFYESGLSRGPHSLTVTVTDTDGLYATALGSLTVNGVPTAPTISLTPSSPDSTDDLRVSIDAASVDPDGDPLTITYTWSLNGVVSGASTTSTLPAASTTRGDTWSIAVVASDGYGDSPAGTASVTIANTAPTLASVVLAPDPAYEEDVLTCTSGATADADGDAVGLSYEWYVNGAALGFDSDSLDSGSFDRGDSVYCTATPTDGTDDGATRSSSTLTIENSAPSIAAVSITPATPKASSTLTCSYSGYADIDGDADQSTYAWTLDGLAVGTGSTLSGTFVGSDVVTCTVTPNDGTDSGTAVANSVTIANTAPVLASVSLTPTAATETSTLTCTPGPTSDADGTSSFTYSYVWTVNSAAIAATTSTLTGTSFSAADSVACVVTPTDGSTSGAAVTSNSVTIANTAPTLASLVLAPDPAYDDDVLTCTAGATADADGDAVGLSYEWYVNGAALGFDSDSLDSGSFDRGDSVYCTATPTDGTDDGATRSSSTVTIENSAPSIAAVSITPSTPKASSTLTCSYSGYADIDGDADQSTYAWTLDGVVVGFAATLSGVFVGNDVVTCTVTPDDGTDSGTAVANSVTIANTAPVLASVSLTPTAATETSTLTCTPGPTTDADGTSSFTYSYAWTVNSAAIAATTSTLTGTSFSAADSVACVVTPNDGSTSGSAVTSNTVTIANTAPVMSTVSVSPATGNVGDALTCAASASDADGSVSYSYAWSTGATGASLTLTASNNPGDVLTCTATATDSAGATATGTASATVSNTAPVVSTVSVSPSTGTVGDVLTCAGSATDADGGSPTMSYAWSTGATGASLTLTASNNPGDVLTCTATATDADGGTDTGSASATVSNTAPVMGTVSISPSTAYNDELLTCSASATDTDGGTPTLTYAWTNTSTATALGSGATLSLSSATAASRASIACAATATDANGGTATGSASVTLGNRAPVATASLTPASPTRTSTLTCAGSATDADVDSASLTFSWTVGGSPVSASSTTALSSTLAGAFVAGQLVACTVTASDGKSGTDTDTASVTIGNTAPVVSSVTLSPSTVYTSDTLTANVVSSDADGDSLSLTYAWYVGGSLVSATSATLSGSSYFSKGQAVYVTATVNDGTTTTSLSSSLITVSNTAPTAPVVEITPVDAESGDDLTCSVTTAATDVDGDALTYVFAWDVDGVDFTSATDAATSSVVDGADVGGEETWTCEVVAGDGTGTSAAEASAAVAPERIVVSVLVDGVSIGTASGPNWDAVTLESGYPRFGLVANSFYTSAGGARIDDVSAETGAGSVLWESDFSSSSGWTLYSGGCCGSTTITGGYGTTSSDYGIFERSTLTSYADVQFNWSAYFSSSTGRTDFESSFCNVYFNRSSAMCSSSSTSSCPSVSIEGDCVGGVATHLAWGTISDGWHDFSISIE